SYQRHEPDRPSLLIKAFLDRAVAAAALVVTAPLMLVVALLVKVTSRGPVLFVQRRGGRNGRPFPMLKFRTMKEGAEKEREALLAANEMDGPVFKISNDPRVTPIGRLLRRTSIDELPQLVNVLAGHMSLVGPRPRRPVEPDASAHDRSGSTAGRPGASGGPGGRAGGARRLLCGRRDLLRGLPRSPGLRDELPAPRGARPHRALLGAGSVRAAGARRRPHGHERRRRVHRAGEAGPPARGGLLRGAGRPGVRVDARLLPLRSGPRGDH